MNHRYFAEAADSVGTCTLTGADNGRAGHLSMPCMADFYVGQTHALEALIDRFWILAHPHSEETCEADHTRVVLPTLYECMVQAIMPVATVLLSGAACPPKGLAQEHLQQMAITLLRLADVKRHLLWAMDLEEGASLETLEGTKSKPNCFDRLPDQLVNHLNPAFLAQAMDKTPI
ncbi:MAG: hypothetical protein WCO52_04750 [bacterium]